MTAPTSLKDLERKIFRASTQDGIIDIHIGCLLLMFSIAPLLSETMGDFWSSAVFLPFWGLVYLGLRALRKNHLQPRIGQIEFGAYRVKRLKHLNLVILVFNLAALGLGLLAFIGILNLPGWLPLSILLLIGFSLGGYMIENPRFYLYGVFSALTPFVGEYLYQNHGFSHHGWPVVFGVLAGGIILWGLFLMLRVIQTYPLTDQAGLE
ncbi:MAG: hypothetical protein DRI46_01410 [Chloroflexi bacterium]|nr:MAG: hypothetical protein DRI46_01410 [Chloroflexota bacterium]